MNNLARAVSSSNNRWGSLASAAVFSVSFGMANLPFDELANQSQHQASPLNYQLVVDSTPTGSTKLYTEFREDESFVPFEDQLAWTNQEINQLFGLMEEGSSPEYSDDLLNLAEALLSSNPQAQKFFG
ncbi:MAG: hypothetical protein WBF88_01015 [Pusillimonas sp.]